jgi:diaminopimelate decarboxylase
MSFVTSRAEPSGPVADSLPDDGWTIRVARAVEEVGTPCYVAAWAPVAAAISRFAAIPTSVPLKSWLSFKTHPLPPLADSWLRSGRGVEVVSESELVTARGLGATAEQLLVNGVAKHTWLPRHSVERLRVHLDSLGELEALLPMAVAERWRVGIRCHVPGECDARDARFGGQFGLAPEEAIAAILQLRAAGADVQSVHFHLGQGRQGAHAYAAAMDFVADLCHEARFAPRAVDVGGGLPSPHDPGLGSAFADLASAIDRARGRFPALEEIWLENGRFVTESCTVLAVRIVDVKERSDSRYLICDGGRTNQALAADLHPRPLVVPRDRSGPLRLTTVCGPTCMTDDRLGRWELPEDLGPGDVLVWRDAGAYHLPWEARFSQGYCAVVWYDGQELLTVAREREQPHEWAAQWKRHRHG